VWQNKRNQLKNTCRYIVCSTYGLMIILKRLQIPFFPLLRFTHMLNIKTLYYNVLGIRAGRYRDSNTEAHPWIRILMNLHFTMMTVTHICLFHRIEFLRRSLGTDRAEDSWRRWEITSEVVSAPEASRWWWTVAKIIGAPEVLMLDDVIWWTRVASSFMEHRNICKSQRAVMTMWLYSDMLG
jgi:hypothetical protein